MPSFPRETFPECTSGNAPVGYTPEQAEAWAVGWNEARRLALRREQALRAAHEAVQRLPDPVESEVMRATTPALYARLLADGRVTTIQPQQAAALVRAGLRHGLLVTSELLPTNQRFHTYEYVVTLVHDTQGASA